MNPSKGLFVIAVSALVLGTPATSTAQNAGEPRSFGEAVGSTAREVKNEVKSGFRTSKRWATETAKSAGKATNDAVKAVKETAAEAVDQTTKATREFVDDVKEGYGNP